MHKLTSEFKEVKQKINHMDTINVENLATIISIAVEKVLEKTKEKTSADGITNLRLSYIRSNTYR